MAVWQWKLYFIPASHLSTLNSGQTINGDEVETGPWEFKPVDEITNYLDKKLIRDNRPYSRDAICWGQVDRNDFSIFLVHGKVESIFARVDVRDSDQFLRDLLDFAMAFDFVFYDLNAESIIPADQEAVTEAIKNSRAMKFFKTPRAFFEDKDYLNEINDENMKLLKELTNDDINS